MNCISAVFRRSRQAVHKLEVFVDIQINMVNTDVVHSNAKSSGIITKLKTISFHNSLNILYKTDTDSNSSVLPFHIFKLLFPKSANKLLS